MEEQVNLLLLRRSLLKKKRKDEPYQQYRCVLTWHPERLPLRLKHHLPEGQL